MVLMRSAEEPIGTVRMGLLLGIFCWRTFAGWGEATPELFFAHRTPTADGYRRYAVFVIAALINVAKASAAAGRSG